MPRRSACPFSARSFENVEYWLDEVEKYAGPNVQKLLVGNKSDLTGSRVITYERGEKFARDKGMKFFETRYGTIRVCLVVGWLFATHADMILRCAVCVLASSRHLQC